MRLVERLAVGVDSITALGSTGSYAYLAPAERARVARLAVEHAGPTPVFIGVGDLRTSRVLAHVDSAQEAGAVGDLLAPMTYHPLTDDDVYELFRTVTEHADLPVIVYDNPGTTDSKRFLRASGFVVIAAVCWGGSGCGWWWVGLYCTYVRWWCASL